MDGKLLAGFGRTDITAPDPIPMGGYGNPLQRLSEGVLLPLKATCVAITDPRGETVLLYTLDHLCTNQNWMEDLRSAVTEATGVRADRILLSATHTHSGPDVRDTITQEHPYYIYFRTQLAKAGAEAMADREEANVFYGDTLVQELNFVRHYVMSDGNMAGDNFGDTQNAKPLRNHHQADHQVVLLRFVRQEKKDILLMNFGAHAKLSSTASSRYGRANRNLQSSDIVGAAREYIEANTPVLVAYFQAAAGNLNPNDPYLLPPNPEKRRTLDAYGQTLGSAVLEALDSLREMTADPFLKTKQTFFKTHHKSTGEIMALELDAVKLGSIGFVTAPYEMFDTHGVMIKTGSPMDATFVLTYANGRFGYIATEETWDYTSADGRKAWELVLSYVNRGAGEELAATFVSMLKELKKV